MRMVWGEDLHSEGCVSVFSVMAFYTKVRFTACMHSTSVYEKERK